MHKNASFCSIFIHCFILNSNIFLASSLIVYKQKYKLMFSIELFQCISARLKDFKNCFSMVIQQLSYKLLRESPNHQMMEPLLFLFLISLFISDRWFSGSLHTKQMPVNKGFADPVLCVDNLHVLPFGKAKILNRFLNIKVQSITSQNQFHS